MIQAVRVRKDREPTTIQSTSELAAYLGLSRWTVSRALNGHPEIGNETRQRVEEAVTRFQFVPSPMARALRGGRTRMVGICLQELEKLNLSSKISTLQYQLREVGFRSLLEFGDGGSAIEAEILQHFISMQVEAVAVFSGVLSRRDAAFRTLREANIPVVQIDPGSPSHPDTVWIDRGSAMEQTARHLLELGHRSFATLGINPQGYYGPIRSRSLAKCLNPPNAPAAVRVVHLFEPEALQLDFDSGQRLAERLLALKEIPTALVCLSDKVAIGAMEYLKGRGYRIPEDFSVTGYDNSDLSMICTPALTTVDPQVDKLIELAVDLLLNSIENMQNRRRPSQRVEPRLILRRSTGKPRGAV